MPDAIKKAIVDVPDYPKKGIVFKDITPVLADPKLLSQSIELLAAPWKSHRVDCVAGIEARGFIFASAVAHHLGAGFVPIRKAGKLPRETFKESYELEYGTDSLEIHRDAIAQGAKVLLIDDLLATGGTAAACIELLKKAKAEIVGASFLIELSFLEGRNKLKDVSLESVLSF